MNIQTIKATQKIKQLCGEYLQKKIDLLVLQNMLNSISSNFENDIPKTLQREVHNFIEDLEYTRFMYNENEQFYVISSKILKLHEILKEAGGDE